MERTREDHLSKKNDLLTSRSMHVHAILVLELCLLMIAGIFPPSYLAKGSSLTEVFALGNVAFEKRYSPEQMRQAISYYEEILPMLPLQSQSFVLDRLSQCLYELTTFSPGNTKEDRDLFDKGLAYGMRSLRLNSGFSRLEKDDFTAAVQKVSDPAALLWTANNWGALFGYNPLQGMVDVGKVKVLYKRGIDLDEAYWGGSFHNALGAMLITLPSPLGGDPEQGRAHLERAIALAPDYLENHVVYAQYWGFTYDLFGKIDGIRDVSLIQRELQFVISAPIGDWPFWNREAKREARALLQKSQEMSGT